MAKLEKTLDRLIKIISKLEAGKKLSIQELADEFEVSKRTIQKDIYQRLIPIGELPILKEDGKIFLDEDQLFLKNNFLDEKEKLILYFSLSIFESSSLFKERAKKLKEKITNLEKNKSFFIKKDYIEEIQLNSVIFMRIINAISNKNLIKIFFDEDEEITVEPYKISVFDGFWYLTCKNIEENKLKMYMYSKIKEVIPLDKKFQTDIDMIEDILKNKVYSSWYEEGVSYEVIVQIRKNIAHYFKQKKFLQSQKILKELPNQDLIVSFEVSHPEDIDNIIKSWLPDIKILLPKSYKNQLIKELEEYLEEIKNEDDIKSI